MKKNIISTTLAIALAVFGLTAQTTEFDAMRLAQTDIQGTARFMGMAGAFGALGGDASAIHVNPAGLGVYRSSELTMTLNLANQRSRADWDGRIADDNRTSLGINNFGLVWANPTMRAMAGSTTGLLQTNWAFSHNRLRDFNRDVTVRGNAMDQSVTDLYALLTGGLPGGFIDVDGNLNRYFDHRNDLGWLSILAYATELIHYTGNYSWSSRLSPGELVTPSFNMRERGSLDEFSISWGGNISNTFFIGANLNLRSINYRMTSTYIEEFAEGRLNMENYLRTTGGGASFGVGVIYRPVHFLRFGLAYQSPMRYELTHTHSGDMISHLFQVGTPQRTTEHLIRTPGRITASAAGVIGQRAIISADVVYTDFSNIEIIQRGRWGEPGDYDRENESMRYGFNSTFTVKVGAEYRITNQFSVRAGFANQMPTMRDAHNTPMKMLWYNARRTDTEYFVHRGTHLFTAGLGYRGNFWYFDAAFVNRNVREDFMPFESEFISPARVTTRNFDVVATVGLRF